jgi:hypothetical protein
MPRVSYEGAFARAMLFAALGVWLFAEPAAAQKQGGSITVGIELDIPGFDPLKVGVYDTAAHGLRPNLTPLAIARLRPSGSLADQLACG